MVVWMVLGVLLSALVILVLVVRPVLVRLPRLRWAVLRLARRQEQVAALSRSAAPLRERVLVLQRQAESVQERVATIKARSARFTRSSAAARSTGR